MKRNLLKTIIAALLAVLVLLAIVSCDSKEGDPIPVETYSVSFVSNGGTEYHSLTSEGQRVIMPIPTKIGAVFAGWYLTEDFSGDRIEGEYLPIADTVFYAKWTETVVYTVEFMSNGGTDYADKTVVEGESISLPTPIKDGFHFGGWFADRRFETEPLGDTYTPTADSKIYAKWLEANPNPLITFDSNGGSRYDRLSTGRNHVKLPVPERENFDFAGWYLTEDLSGERLADVVFFDDDTTVYAKWTLKSGIFEISFDTDGGTEEKPLYSNGEHIVLPVPQKYGYRFVDWYIGDEKVGGSYGPTESVTLKARWEEVNYVYLYCDDSARVIRLEKKAGDKIKLSELPSEATMPHLKDGKSYPFIGWKNDNGTTAPKELTLEGKHVYLVASYDYTGAPVNYRLNDIGGGQYQTTGKVIYPFFDSENGLGTYSIELSFNKTTNDGTGTMATVSGAAGVVLHLTTSGKNYPYEEAGTEYFAATIVPSTGELQVSRIQGGSFGYVSGGIVPLANLPESFRNDYNSNNSVTVKLTVKSYTDKFEIYVNDTLAFTMKDASALSLLRGTGFGIRSSSVGVVFKNATYTPAN